VTPCHSLCVMLMIKIALIGVPWTEEEHRKFLLGLQKLGKGDWRGISWNFVVSRTPTQVASHAQKYFIRQSNVSRRKRRSSLFDMVPDEVTCLILSPIIMQKLVKIAMNLYM
jgi:SHAQKYF class myb-like DNA-binding protein